MSRTEKTNLQVNRRQLLAGGVRAALVAPFVAMALQTSELFAQMKAFVAETDPVAKALKYIADVSKAKPDPRKDKPGAGGKTIAGAKQLCENCLQYTVLPPIGGKPAGKCNMIQSGAVEPKGWCSVWAHKPGTLG